ncbi:MAG: malonate decarboxylase holo-[acyl-carrier-protein] synthase [Arcobacter sp.]|uniref:malonate decarboxylase holo-[acyl-carrier-protein] synthase n=1 Tax=Arcobacter sp. TaxID=1872629 RepID=UPI003C763FFB
MKRHDLVWLDENYCKSNEFLISSFSDKSIILNWINKNNPFIVTRQLDNNDNNTNLAFLLPLEEGKKRVGVIVNTNSISKKTSPVTLSQVLSKIEKKWQVPLKELVDLFLYLGVELFVFGSSMWESIIGQKYMTENSDVDLLWKPKTFFELEKGLEYLKEWMNKYSLKIDGEVELPCESACSWKELLNDDDNIIVKGLNKVSLENKADFINSIKG